MPTTSTLHPSTHLSSESERHLIVSVHATLRAVFVILPVVAGVDKFFNFLVRWEVYLNPAVLRIIPTTDFGFMKLAGIIEIIAGLVVWAKPRAGGYLVMMWLIAIALQLLAMGRYFDIAIRDLVMAITGALTLARLTTVVGENTPATQL